MWAIGGYNSSGTTASVQYPSYAKADIWMSTDGFQTYAWSPGQTGYPRLAAMAAYLANGNLLTWGGLAGEYGGYIIYDVSVTYSQDGGFSWNTSYTDANAAVQPVTARYEAAYCALPFTNTVVHTGGYAYGPPSNDVWISSDGIGAFWTRTNPGGSATNVPAHYGSSMVAMYDSTYVSSQYFTPNSTLVLVLTQPYIFTSIDLGATWQGPIQAPWAAAITPVASYARALAALTADHDNYLYYGGGDSGTAQPDFWLSIDKAQSWSRIAVVNTVSGGAYAAAIGSCMAVRLVAGQKQIALYGGDIYTLSSTTNQYTSNSAYALQMNVNFVSRSRFNFTSSVYPVPYPSTTTYYWQYGVTSTSPSYTICASGTMTLSTYPSMATVNSAIKAYAIYWMTGVRVFSNSTYTLSQQVAGLAPIGTDGASGFVYPGVYPSVDSGGLTYYLAGQGLENANNFINIYSNNGPGVGGTITEDGIVGTTNLTTPFTISPNKQGLQCQIYATATITQPFVGAAASTASLTGTPQYRSNPECAFDLNATNPAYPTMWAIGGYNVTGGGAAIPYPSYARGDTWFSTDGFTSSAATYTSGAFNYGRLAANAAYLANGNLLVWGGLAGEYGGYVWYTTSVGYSQDQGRTWNYSYTDNLNPVSVARYESAYCAIPYTNIAVTAGGFAFGTLSSDVWISSDGIGAVWTQMNSGGSASNVPVHSGSVMVGMYDSSYVSAQFPSMNATLLLVLDTGYYYKSTSLGSSWTTAYAAPWVYTFVPYPTYTRSLPVLTCDRNNYLYYGGGDTGSAAPDFWLSIDKAESWTQIGVVNSVASGVAYAAAVGSCLGARIINGQTQLSLYGGQIYTYSGGSYADASYYSLQMTLSFSSSSAASTAVTNPIPQPSAQIWYWRYGLTSSSGFTICATGRLVTASTPTIFTATSSNPAYLVWWMTGNRLYTSGGTTTSQLIAGLAPLGDDGASNYIYPSQNPPVDGGGLTYLLASTGLGDSYNFINLYSNGTYLFEDGFTGTETVTTPLTLSKTAFSTNFCPFYATSSLSSGLSASVSGTNPPKPRFNPECAFDQTSANPTMFALGGSADGGVTGLSDMWYSTDGFSSTWTYKPALSGIGGRMNGGAGYLANGNLVWWGGIITNQGAATYYEAIFYSNNWGTTWNISFDNLGPTLRQSFAYTAVPYTNTLVMTGGILYSTSAASSDTWISTDGIGSTWTLQSNGTNITPFSGGSMVALFDSSYVSSQYPSLWSTLVLVADNKVYSSPNLGIWWSNATTAPWPVSSTGNRRYPALTADRDNFVYLVGGDNVSPDIWFSQDKGYSWTQLGYTSSLAVGNYAAALGACIAVTVTGSTKTLSVYSGNIYSYTAPAFTQNYYSLQLPISTQTTQPTYSTVTLPSTNPQQVYWTYTLAGTNNGVAYSVCAVGVFTVSGIQILGVSPMAYQIYTASGTRTLTSGTTVKIQQITALGPLGDDGASQRLYTVAPSVDGGGVTLILDGPLATVGAPSGTTSPSYINLYNNSGTITEDGWYVSASTTYLPVQSGSGFRFTISSASTNPYSCGSSSPTTTPSTSSSTGSATASRSSSSTGSATASRSSSTAAATGSGGGGQSNSSSSSLSGGAIAGIVIGSIAGALLVILAILFCLVGRKGKSGATQMTDDTGSEHSVVPSQMEMAPVEHSQVATGEGEGETHEEV
jgi:hypothetical protein